MNKFADPARSGRTALAIASLMLPLHLANAAAEVLEVDHAGSKIEVFVKTSVDSFIGHLGKYEASVEMGDNSQLPAKAVVTFDFADLKTGNSGRDAAMLKWLGYDKDPKASFVLNGWSSNGTTNLAVGELTIHGVKRTVEMPVKLNNESNRWEISGECKLDHRDFNLPKIRKALILTVDPHIRISFHLVAGTADANK